MTKWLAMLVLVLPLMAMNQNKKKVKDPQSEYTHCQLIEKSFTNKGGKITQYKELYLRCSVQDYFIKLCESSVTKEQLLPFLNQGIAVKMEVRDGMLDHCNENKAYVQSRTGPYVIILEIKDTK